MSVEKVSKKKFDALYKKRIDLKKCPVCEYNDAEIIIPMPIFGRYMNTVYIKCKQCGYQTKHHRALNCFLDTEQNRYGSFVTDKSLMRALYGALNEWNNERSENGKLQ